MKPLLLAVPVTVVVALVAALLLASVAVHNHFNKYCGANGIFVPQ